MIGTITWDGVRSDRLGVFVETYPTYNRPARKKDTYQIPGRNGDLVMMQDAWENVRQEYNIIIGDGSVYSSQRDLDGISQWLLSPSGYCELYDDFDKDHYRLAYYAGGFEAVAIARGEAARVKIAFECQPQRYLFTGRAQTVRTASPSSIYNPTLYKSRPLLFIKFADVDGARTVTVAGTTFTVSADAPSEIYIDCESMDCYTAGGSNVNSLVSSSTSEFATLNPGSNVISFGLGVESVWITPRWFDI